MATTEQVWALHAAALELAAHVAEFRREENLLLGASPWAVERDTYGHLWPDRDESTRAAVEAVFADRADSLQTTAAR